MLRNNVSKRHQEPMIAGQHQPDLRSDEMFPEEFMFPECPEAKHASVTRGYQEKRQETQGFVKRTCAPSHGKGWRANVFISAVVLLVCDPWRRSRLSLRASGTHWQLDKCVWTYATPSAHDGPEDHSMLRKRKLLQQKMRS